MSTGADWTLLQLAPFGPSFEFFPRSEAPTDTEFPVIVVLAVDHILRA